VEECGVTEIFGLYWCGWHEVQDLDSFDIIVDLIGTCKEHPQPHIFKAHQQTIVWPFADGPELPNLFKLAELAEYLNHCLANGRKILIFCAAGWNRSGLLVGEIVKLRCPQMSGSDIVRLLKSKRSMALNNKSFEAYITGHMVAPIA
jgi:hypothetical protein